MHRQRFALALERISSEQWKRFEEFASAFLVPDYPNLRTVASAAGDKGRDAELFSPDGQRDVVLQFSVSGDWKTKLRDTAKRIAKEIPEATLLIYATNQRIGAAADAIKHELRSKFNLVLDVLDSSWFLDRYEGNEARESLGEKLAVDIVDPYLASKGVVERKATALSGAEAKVALLFLTLQWEDDTREKGLTKLAFEALVRGVLRGTDSSHRMSRADAHKGVWQLLASHDKQFVVRQTDSTLLRLAKRSIRHHTDDDTFCLTYEESLRVKDHLTAIESRDRALEQELESAIRQVLPNAEAINEELAKCVQVCRRVIEKFLFGRGEQFAAAVSTGTLTLLPRNELRKLAAAELQQMPLALGKRVDGPSVIEAVSNRVLSGSSEVVRHYVRTLSDGYTLFAFLQQTPDVQEAVRKVFTAADVWVDTGVVLRLFSESLLDPAAQEFQRVFELASEVGIRFKVTGGVIEETERHMNRCLACANTSSGWQGRVPYLLAEYVRTGHSRSGFAGWLDNFRGLVRPEDDIAEYLRDFHKIEPAELAEDLSKAGPELRAAVNEVWTKIHTERRKKAGFEMDSMLIARLAIHDSENYVGVIQRRKKEVESPFGFTSWWLTIDHMAFHVSSRLATWLHDKPPQSPVMSMNFLSNYLIFGPIRGRLSKEAELSIPTGIHDFSLQHITPDLLQLAEEIRLKNQSLPEHVIRRKVRDALDAAKRSIGPVVPVDEDDSEDN